MGVFDKFKDLVGIEEYDDDDITEEEIDAADAQLERKRIEPRSGYARRDKVVEMKNRGGSPFKLIVTDPEGFEECPKLVDSLKQRKPVILNLEKMDSDTAKKIFDFLSGATYALNGNVQKVADNIFIFAPENVDISATVESKGFDFSGDKDNWR
ncbi:MAG: cell division protein SepF [Anaerovoracaceae bacterium]|jgi:cell division inhibitor SepF